MEQSIIVSLIKEQQLPDSFIDTVESWYLPLLNGVCAQKQETPFLLGVQGSQGSGKSTLASFLSLLAQQTLGIHAVCLSLDDFYLTHGERRELAQNIHPLLATRGVPGTHDVELALKTINALKQCSASNPVRVPRFNKAIDDRLPEAEWDTIDKPVDMVIFEGWCVGCEPQLDTSIEPPINELERLEDADGAWRRYVNQQLAHDYQHLFNELDQLAILVAPSFECVYDWRWLQEKKLYERLKTENSDTPTRLLDEAGVRRFISHYERLTRHCLSTLPSQADWVLSLDKDHNITELLSKHPHNED